MAHRTLLSMRSALRSLQPTMRCSCAAESPRLSFAESQMTRNQSLSGRCVRSIMVPAVTLSWREHLVHCHLCAPPGFRLQSVEYNLRLGKDINCSGYAVSTGPIYAKSYI